jgi:hypothetical protein
MRIPAPALALAALLATTSAHALDGGQPATLGALSAASVAIQAVQPTADGRARISECTGVLIAPDLVLTAAHCLDAAEGPQHVAVFFFAGAKAAPPFSPVAAIARHSAHTRGWAGKPGSIETRQKEIAADLAVLRLTTPAPAGHAPLASGTGTPASLAGAGIAGPGGRSGTLKTAPLGGIKPTTSGPSLTFATPANSRVCRGDSGGPVVTASGALWGISGAILRGKDGCAARVVAVPFEPSSPAVAEMIQVARRP